MPPYTFYCHPIRLLSNVKKSLTILLFGPLLSYTFIRFQEKFQPILLFRPVRLFGTLEYCHSVKTYYSGFCYPFKESQ